DSRSVLFSLHIDCGLRPKRTVVLWRFCFAAIPPRLGSVCRRRIIFGATCARGRGMLAAGPELRITGAAAQTRMVSVARIRLVSRKSTRLFKGIISDDISEFESYMPSQPVQSLWVMSSSQKFVRHSLFLPYCGPIAPCGLLECRAHRFPA